MKNVTKTFLVAAALVAASAAVIPTAASAQGYVAVYGPPAGYVTGPAPGLYDYAPGYAVTAPAYTYAPGYWYGGYDTSHNSYRQPSPSSTIRAVR